MTENMHEHLYPLMDAMTKQTVEEIESDEETKISCHNGCDHCCHLLIEVTWEEAKTMAKHVAGLPQTDKNALIDRIRTNAHDAKTFFAERPAGKPFLAPIDENIEIPERLYDEYFFTKVRPCPFLVDKSCSVYNVRPTPCRFHMVSSPSENCSREAKDAYVEIPEDVDQMRDSLEPVIDAISLDGRWGHMSIMVEAALEEMGELN